MDSITNSKLFSKILNDEILTFGQIKTFDTDTTILDFDSYIKTLPIVISGIVKVIRTDENGKEILLYYIKPGESCIMSFLAGIHNNKSKIKAIIEEEAKILLIPINKASDWIKVFPEWSDFIFELYQKRFEELLLVVNSVTFKKLDIRIIELLKQKANMFNTNELKITHQQLAYELGTTREVVSRILKQIENENIISLSRNKITILK